MVPIKGADDLSRSSACGHGATARRIRRASRIWWVGGGVSAVGGFWTVRSTATELWSVWWDQLASVRPVWSARRGDCWKPRRRGVLNSANRTRQVPFHAVTRLLRAAAGVAARTRRLPASGCARKYSDADEEDLLLFDDLLGIADPAPICRISIPMPVGAG